MSNKLITYAANNRTYDRADIMQILLEISRDEAIIFLTWNDPNGVYMDLDCLKEGTEPLQETEAKLICFKQLMENSEIPVNSKQAKCEQLLATICKKVMEYEDYTPEVSEACKLLDIKEEPPCMGDLDARGDNKY